MKKDLKEKAIFIPADCIKIGNSRSFAIAMALVNVYDIYWLKWKDSRDFEWENKKLSVSDKVVIFLKNLFRGISIKETNGYHEINFPFLQDNFLRIFSSKVVSQIFSSWFNTISLKIIVSKINPKHIFYMDGFYYFRAVSNEKIKIWMDIQDDHDFTELKQLDRYLCRKYMQNQLKMSHKNYTVSNAAATNMSKEFSFPFFELPNGAWFDSILSVTQSEINETKKKLGIEKKIILTYIGGIVWYDENFVKKLMTALLPYEEYVLVAVGNLPIIELPNIINIGAIDNEKTYVYYRLTDIGLLLKDSTDSLFLKNSQPLKIIQYSVAKKPVITFPISWIHENNFKNIFSVCNTDSSQWIKSITSLKNFDWTYEMDKQWYSYDWNRIAMNYLVYNCKE